MQNLTIGAASMKSARGFYAALTDFHAELIPGEVGGSLVRIDLNGSNGEIVAVLHAIEGYVSHRGDGPAIAGRGDQSYTLLRNRPARRRRR
jgi:hypothetical protein